MKTFTEPQLRPEASVADVRHPQTRNDGSYGFTVAGDEKNPVVAVDDLPVTIWSDYI